jgi:Zn-dependent protease with chaperone function
LAFDVSASPVNALHYDGRTSRPERGTVAVESAGRDARLHIRAGTVDRSIALVEIDIGERVGETGRLLRLPDGGSIEILDNSAFDGSLRAAGWHTPEEPIRFLEGRWRYAVLAGVITVLLSVGFLRYGLPALAERAVRFIPASADALIARDTLRALDATVLAPSALSAERRAQLTRVFYEVSHDAPTRAAHFELVFRKGGSLRANALALPSGVVILTDELVGLSESDDELRGVFAHEVGHIVHRHATRMLVQSSASTLLLAGLFGDVSAASTLTAVAPTVLVSSAYSRDFERQADAHAFQWMSTHHVSARHFGDLLERVVAKYGTDSGGYLASHPDLEERVRAASK